jgi:hypothetical protein
VWADWFAETWAELVAAALLAGGLPDVEVAAIRAQVEYVHRRPVAAADTYEGERCTDPKRVAVYFTKHGLLAGKEYQHRPPAPWLEAGGSGRWWGVWGLAPVEVAVPVTLDQAVRLSRTVKRWHDAGARRPLAQDGAAPGGTFGFLSVNDGAAAALMLSAAAAAEHSTAPPDAAPGGAGYARWWRSIGCQPEVGSRLALSRPPAGTA